MAAEVEFHTGVVDVAGFACRLLRKAHRQGAQLLVTAPEVELARLDRQLWTQEQLDFLPHVRLPAAAAVVARSPIWLAAEWQQAADLTTAEQAARRVLVNLGAELPEAPARLVRIIEVVGAEPEQVEAGRQRWRAYKALGLGIVHHPAA